MSKVRCAIYTRKSSEEGLEQAFNSLHAQREACAAYVLSQASEGWTLLPEVYDDGGISGGTLERPGLICLLADIAAGRIDIAIVRPGDEVGVSAGGLLAAILFEPVAAGTGTLTISGSGTLVGGGVASLQFTPAGVVVR